jgi:Flp pilus assembly protein TadB
VTVSGPAPALLALAAALLLWLPAGAVRRARARDLLPVAGHGPTAAAHARGQAAGRSSANPQSSDQPTRSAGPPGRYRRWAGAGTAGVAVLVLLGGGPGGAVAGLGVAVLAERLLRRSGGPPPGDAVRDLPVACDLLAVCLAAGTPIGAAVAAVSEAVAGPLGAQLDRVGAHYRLGAAPRQAWSGVPPGVTPLARVLVRAGESGSSVVPSLQRLATDLRTAQRGAVEAAVRRAGVWVLAPLGICFLPAFLCLGVVPMVLGIAADVFG